MTTPSASQDPQLAHLLMLSADEISYESLPTETLSALALQMTDPFIATSALGELAQRDPQQTKNDAAHILERGTWDRHLTAFALTLLYDRDPDGGLLQMARLVVGCMEPKILEAMIENILSDADRYRTREGATLARTVAGQVASVSRTAFSDVEQRDRFLEMFGDRGG